MKIYSWNVNGIRAVWNKGLFQKFIAEEQPDIVCLQEIKAMQEQGEVDLPDYTEYWNPAVKKGYSGTAIFSKKPALSIREDIPAHIANKIGMKPDSFGDPNTEGRVIVAEFKYFFVATCYTPNAKPDLGRLSLRHTMCDPAFLAYMKELEKEKPVMFCGDLNVAYGPDDLANPKASAQFRHQPQGLCVSH